MSAAARALAVVAALALVLALLAGYVRRAVGDDDQFANRAAVALRDDDVRTLVAERVTDQLVLARESDLLAARPLIESVVSSVAGSAAFSSLFRSAVRDVHRAVLDGNQDTLTLTLTDIGTVVAAALEAVRPELAEQIESTRRLELVRRDLGAFGADAARFVHTVRVLALLLLAVAVGCAVAAVALARDRRRAVVELGIAIAAAGVLLVVALAVGRTVAAGEVSGAGERAAVAAVWDAFMGDLRAAAWLLAGVGAVVAAAAASLIRPVAIDAPLRRVARWVAAEPARPAGRVLRGAALIAAGLCVLLARDVVLQLLFTAAGVYLVYSGVSAILWVVNRPRERVAEAPAAGPSRRRTLVAALAACALVGGAAAAFLGAGGVSAAAPAAGPCNGHVELCDRRLTEVALPATHNSMSVPLQGWYSAEQDHPIDRQLRDGIRGLLIDTHYADRLSNGRLRTDVDESQLRAQAEQDGVSASAVDAALRLRARLGFAGGGERGIYLCHSFCELGGTPFEEVLDSLHDFLVTNPNEVVVIINQDYVTPADFVAAVRAADLERFAYRGPATGRWPTLRELIDSGQRVVFLAENHAGAVPWYRLAYEAITEETPYAFSKVAQLADAGSDAASCRPNRGPERAPLFLVNHWITTDPVPLPSNAEQVNAYAPLLRRLRECERIRSHVPNLVAVNFYARGDLFRAVDAVNGIAAP